MKLCVLILHIQICAMNYDKRNWCYILHSGACFAEKLWSKGAISQLYAVSLLP